MSGKGIQTDPEKTKAVREWPSPKNVSEVRRFLGLLSYYRRFIPNFATKAEALNKLTRKGSTFQWEKEQENAFNESKSAEV